MKSINTERPPLLWHQNEFFRPLTTPFGLVQLKQTMRKNRILITFANGYGVMIIPVLPDGGDEVFDLTVLRFHGAGILDHRVAQYLPIPELSRGDFDETIDSCLKVSRLPQRGLPHGGRQPANPGPCAP